LNLINEGAEDNAEHTQPMKTGMSVFKFIFEILQTVILALILYFVIDSVVARVRVENISMLPTLESGEFLLVNKLAYRIGDYQQGDIIVFHYPKNPQDDYIKRIIGLPGDTVTVTQEEVYVNGNQMDEAYIAEPPGYDGEWIVPPDSIFVLGDNRNQSSDSHSWGFVPLDDVVGKAIVIYWPLDELKILNSPAIVNAANTN
jgi:signal peptidase I